MADWPKRENAGNKTKYCYICRKRIEPGEAYHYISRNGRHYFHDRCYKEELNHDDTGARH